MSQPSWVTLTFNLFISDPIHEIVVPLWSWSSSACWRRLGRQCGGWGDDRAPWGAPYAHLGRLSQADLAIQIVLYYYEVNNWSSFIEQTWISASNEQSKRDMFERREDDLNSSKASRSCEKKGIFEKIFLFQMQTFPGPTATENFFSFFELAFL